MSLPVRGAWIEIRRYIALTHGRPCRSPCGERGLKCTNDAELQFVHVSLPVRGAWIEILVQPLPSLRRRTSLPVRGAWIEIASSASQMSWSRSRSPCGERGLKSGRSAGLSAGMVSLPVRGAWIEMQANIKPGYIIDVAPRAGSVD